MPRKRPTPTADAPAPPKPRGRRFESFKAAAAKRQQDKAVAINDEKREAKAAAFDQVNPEGDLVDIWERRILNPHHQESIPIRIKTPGMHVRWINLANRSRYYRARFEQGWVPVHRTELVDDREVFGASYTADGSVCRGEKQSEMLMKIPEAVFRRIQARKSELARESYKKLRENMGAAGASHFKDKLGGSAGDQAAEAAANFKGTISYGTERVSSDELFD